MCKMIAVLTTTKDQAEHELINQLIQANHEDLATQKSGYSVYDGKRTYNYIGDTAYQMQNIYKNVRYTPSSVWMTHFRISTGGSNGVDGLHLQNINGYIFAHNGTISGMKNIQKKSDSWYFFRRLIETNKTINNNTIQEACTKYGFSGKGFLYNPKTRIFYFFNNQEAYITVLPNTLILSSYKLKTELKTYVEHTILGYTWRTDTGTKQLPIIVQHEIDNTYMMFKDNILIERGYIENASGYNSGYYRSGYPYGHGFDFDREDNEQDTHTHLFNN